MLEVVDSSAVIGNSFPIFLFYSFFNVQTNL